ncbi:efflux transporter, RND family, MFP subunit [Magnetococcus marinus MC-1]|uniref:Efflux transporter, RND family, MFP subunit n=1 Tax=Magnetococcus marinus (strain ATCC BAA-1437 / JCM 17883 / MC-1) TaxID=156889 RepID=A0LAN1_MAGMM|nr:efflux RND transporter periplasmic adaptor subunit [Magnetococcus marinus]ABK45024.1 efflux transporter, RND family, MFP subunit [Magnetococcus marinus MC-1]
MVASNGPAVAGKGRYAWLIWLLVLAGLGYAGYQRVTELMQDPSVNKEKKQRAIPVEVAPVVRGPLEAKRTFSGTLEANAELSVAPKVAGRVTRLDVRLADAVSRGQLVAELDRQEHEQVVVQSRAELAVAQANLAEAESLLENAQRALKRSDELRQKGISSEVQSDTALANQLAYKAKRDVARAQLIRAQAVLTTAEIRLAYTHVEAEWQQGAPQRLVAERLVEVGEMVAANQPLLRLVELDPLKGVFYVTEKDYPRLQVGQPLQLTTDAYPQRSFRGTIERVAPVFRQAARQARVELQIENPGQLLKPGMFIRATVVLEQVAQATIVPFTALTKLSGVEGLYSLSADRSKVQWCPVRVGIRQASQVAVTGGCVGAYVVTLGQEMLNDGTAVRVVDKNSAGKAPAGKAPIAQGNKATPAQGSTP